MEKGLFTSLGRSWSHWGKTHVKTSADAAHQSPLPSWPRVSGCCLWAVRGRWQRSEVPLPVASLLCFLLPSHLYLWAGGWAQFTCIWGGPLSPGQSGTEERGLKHYWFTSWPDQKTPDRAPPLLHLVREVEEAAQQEGPRCAPIVVHCRWVLPDTHWGVAGLPGGPTPHPRALGPQRRDWEDWLLHRHQHLLPAAAARGRGGHPEDHMPAPSGQVS